jgi:hypothetical protein
MTIGIHKKLVILKTINITSAAIQRIGNKIKKKIIPSKTNLNI